jgi:hypothetical protein
VTADEADTLAADLQRAGVRVEGIEPRPHYEGEWQVRYSQPDLACFLIVVDAARFRQSVRNGHTELPRNALD